MTAKYFLPDWEDRLDPDFDFIRDQYSKEHKKNPYKHDIYIHQLYEKHPHDGVLFSLSVFQSKIGLNGDGASFKIRESNNIKDYLKISDESNLEIMGDCGAFGYVIEEKPPEPFYTVDNVANIYDKLGFDYGVSVDHLVIDFKMVKDPKTGKRKKRVFSKSEKDNRIKLTLNNAKKFLKLHKTQNYDFKPIGVAQGYDLETYRTSVESLVEMGYEYIALGGIVQYKSEFIIDILETIQQIAENVDLHLFGVSRPNYIQKFEKLGVTSFDSASFLRKAWLRSGQNYLAPNGEWYAAIRVPQASNPRLLNNLDSDISLDDLKDMEQKSLDILFKYDQGLVEVDEVLEVILKYDNLLLRNSNDGKNLRKKYKRTLEDMPWKSCNCEVCKKIGINVIIFRGCNRNKRRGFHNIWTFRNSERKKILDEQISPKTPINNSVLCIIPCGKKKIWDKQPDAQQVYAKDVYIGSFSKKCKQYAEKFYPNSWYILSAKHGFLSPMESLSTNYNVSFNDRYSNTIAINKLISQVAEKNLEEYDEIVVLGGKHYTEIVTKIFSQKEIHTPLENCKGIGYMMQKLNDSLNNENTIETIPLIEGSCRD